MRKILYSLLAKALLLPACKPDDPVEPDPCSVYPAKMEIQIEWQNRQWSTLSPIASRFTDPQLQFFGGVSFGYNFKKRKT